MYASRLTATTIMLFAGLLTANCAFLTGLPDRRNAMVEVKDYELHEYAQFAIDWWNLATSQVTAEVGDCVPERTCVTLVFGYLPEPAVGRNISWSNPVNGENGSRVIVHPEMSGDPDGLQQVVAHELGHSFGMPHTADDDIDLMRPNGIGNSCIEEVTLTNWALVYGNSDSLKVVCSFEVGQ
jgi:hypothetical protein